jgi:hypothetical protein
MIPIALKIKFGILYADEGDIWAEDPDQPKLERTWDRKVKISRVP